MNEATEIGEIRIEMIMSKNTAPLKIGDAVFISENGIITCDMRTAEILKPSEIMNQLKIIGLCEIKKVSEGITREDNPFNARFDKYKITKIIYENEEE